MAENINEKIAEIKRIAEKFSLSDLSEKARAAVSAEAAVYTFAACFKAAEEKLGVTPFDEQLKAADALYRGKVIEMATGEGKTLAAVFAACAKAIEGKRVHILTFNDYLANRDMNWMKPIYDSVGVTAACITENTPREQRKAYYKADVLYTTVKECGFDFLRDFVAKSESETVQQPFMCAIADEADSLLIDEARIPLVVAGNVAVEPDEEMPAVMDFVKSLSEKEYSLSDITRTAYLTDKGAEKAESHFGADNIYDEENSELLVKINECLKANYLLTEDKDYIVKDGEIQLIDEFTGRVAKNRHYPGSLQTAVEVKHGIAPTTRGTIMGTIAIQFFIRQYPELAGMTGTAAGAKDEFYQLYGLEPEIIPPHVPSARVDLPMAVYYDSSAKYNAVAAAIEQAHGNNQPVLAGTSSIAESERLAALLKEKGIECSVLNAKNDEMEAKIIKDAGLPGAVTISTNMAGRGVDIKLGGADEKYHDEAAAAGGLFAISTFLAESSRINNQLKGRAGRQGDIGRSQVFVSLDEQIMENCELKSLVPSRHYPEPTAEQLTDKVLLREIERVQRISEGNALDERKRLMKFTMIGEKHRDAAFSARKRFMTGKSTPHIWKDNLPDEYEQAVNKFGAAETERLERDITVQCINDFWTDYLEYTSSLREGIHLMAVGGKSPAEEYNIACEEYFNGMEDELTADVCEKLGDVLKCSKAEDYHIAAPTEIWTYLLEDAGDELKRKRTIEAILSDEVKLCDDDLDDDDDSDEQQSEDSETEQTEKKGFFAKLFGKKK